jgi:hypothetical protein
MSTVEYLQIGDYIELNTVQTSGGSLSTTTNSVASYIYITKLQSSQQIFETELVAASYTSDSGQSIPTSKTTMLYEDKIIDTHNAYNTSTGAYTVPVTGVYEAFHRYGTAAYTPASAGTLRAIYIEVDGTEVSQLVLRAGNTSSTTDGIEVFMSPRTLTEGQVVTFRAIHGQASVTMNTEPQRNGFGIKRIK